MFTQKILKKKETNVRRTQESKTEITDPGRVHKEKYETSVHSSTIETELVIERNVADGPASVSPANLEMGIKEKGESSTSFMPGGYCNRISGNPTNSEDFGELHLDDQTQQENDDTIFISTPMVGKNVDSISSGDKHQDEDSALENVNHSRNIKLPEDKNPNKIAREEGLERGDSFEVNKFVDDKQDLWKTGIGFDKDNPESSVSGQNSVGNCCMKENTFNKQSEANGKIPSLKQSNCDLKVEHSFIPEILDDSTLMENKSTSLLYKDSSVRSKIPKINSNIKSCSVRPHNAYIKDSDEDLVKIESKGKVWGHENDCKKYLDKDREKECVCWKSDKLENCVETDKENLRRSVSNLINHFEGLKNSNAKQLNSLTEMAKAIEISELNICKEDKDKDTIEHFYTNSTRPLPDDYSHTTGRSKKRIRDRNRNSSPKENKIPKEHMTSHPRSFTNPSISRIPTCDLYSDAKEKYTGQIHERDISNNIMLPQEGQVLLNNNNYDPPTPRNRFSTSIDVNGVDAAAHFTTKDTMKPFSTQNEKRYISRCFDVSKMKATNSNRPIFPKNLATPGVIRANDHDSLRTISNHRDIRKQKDGYYVSGQKNEIIHLKKNRQDTWKIFGLDIRGYLLIAGAMLFGYLHYNDINIRRFFKF